MEKVINSPVGKIYVCADSKGITGINWRKKRELLNDDNSKEAAKYITKLEKELDLYFKQKLKKFTVPFHFEGTDFQKRVWKQLCKIPFGKTISYKELAKRVGNEKACRAVGTANGKNPLSIIVPCHRVIAADSSLGGYAGGLKTKSGLLELEGLSF